MSEEQIVLGVIWIGVWIILMFVPRFVTLPKDIDHISYIVGCAVWPMVLVLGGIFGSIFCVMYSIIRLGKLIMGVDHE